MRFLFLFLLIFCSFPVWAREHVILCGGPALRKWENLRVEHERHDRWWANFVRASTMRMDEIKKSYNPGASITWIVYHDGYVLRCSEDGNPYPRWMAEQAAQRRAYIVT